MMRVRNQKDVYLADALVRRAIEAPDRHALTMVEENGAQLRLTARELYVLADRYARGMQKVGVQEGDLIILVLRHSLELVATFWGAALLGAIPSIFPYLTEKLDPESYMDRVKILIEQAAPRAVITFPENQGLLSRLLADTGCKVLSVEEIERNVEQQPSDPRHLALSEEHTAILTYSSGTTGLQKGVAISHRSILLHQESLVQSVDLRADDVIVSWLPLYHDLGLLGGLILPVLADVPTILMSSIYWVRNPASLLHAFSDHGATLCWMPNFAFNHSVRSVRERDLQGIDLSGVRFLINSAEPVRHRSNTLFIERFAEFGFEERALGTGYGMAENGVVSISPPGGPLVVDWVDRRAFQALQKAVPGEETRRDAMPIVSCGILAPGIEAMIMDDHGHERPERHVGEIVLRSPFLFKGYYRRPDLTSEAIRDGWFFSGDMGYLWEGQLFVTGRKKDIIIVAGNNIYPEDIESVANMTQGVYPGRAAAFGMVDDRLGSEGIVLVYEAREDQDPKTSLEIERALRKGVVDEVDIALMDVRQVPRGWVIKAASGKIARNANREKYIEWIKRES